MSHITHKPLGLPRYEKIITLTTVITVGLGMLAFLQQAPIDMPLPFIPGNPAIGLGWLLSVGLIVIAAVGADVITRSYRGLRQSERMWLHLGSVQFRTAPRYWILPALSVTGFVLFFRIPSNALVLYAAVACAAAVFGGILIAQYHSLEETDPYYRIAIFSLGLAIYIVGFISFTAIYVNKVRSLVSATGILIVATLLMFEVLANSKQPTNRVAIYSLVSGVVLGEATWALNYWPASAMAGGLFLLAAFHGLGGLITAYFKGELRPRPAAEFGLVSLVGMALSAFITFGGR